MVTPDEYITSAFRKSVKQNIDCLKQNAEPDTGKALYVYDGFETYYDSKYGDKLRLIFHEVYTGAIAYRTFNIKLSDTHGNPFTAGPSGEFRIVGKYQRPTKGTFIRFYMDVVGEVPEGNKPNKICKCMYKLKGVAVSCANPKKKNGVIYLKDVRVEGLWHV